MRVTEESWLKLRDDYQAQVRAHEETSEQVRKRASHMFLIWAVFAELVLYVFKPNYWIEVLIILVTLVFLMLLATEDPYQRKAREYEAFVTMVNHVIVAYEDNERPDRMYYAYLDRLTEMG